MTEHSGMQMELIVMATLCKNIQHGNNIEGLGDGEVAEVKIMAVNVMARIFTSIQTLL